MNVEIVGKNVVITMPLQEPEMSKTGKTMVVASSHGNQLTQATVSGKQLSVGVNVYYKP